jgi:outer membrane usher protein FimD/PapC
VIYRKGLMSAVLFLAAGFSQAAEEIQFNMDVLDVKDRQNIDLSLFSRSNYIMPGSYNLALHVNQQRLSEITVHFLAPPDDPRASLACLTPEHVAELGLRQRAIDHLTWWNDGLCLDIDSINGMRLSANLGQTALYVVLPQAELEYTAPNWDPPSRWDEGIAGAVLDYNLNAQTTRSSREGGRSTYLSGNGTTGMNLGPWRLRVDWQAQAERGQGRPSKQRFDWSRFYAKRAIPGWKSSLIVGEDYLNSNLFGGFRYTGASLATNDSMLPPNLRGYAPEITGVARSNARVVVRQQGRVLYETQVPPGAFRIQDLNDAVSGNLDVSVEEQDGSHQNFQVATANIPYLSRPGSLRFSVTTGKPSEWNHRLQGPAFGTGELSWGVSNGWSLFGGALAAKDYGAVAIGVGRDLMAFGALSFDVTQSRTTLGADRRVLTGKSYRVSYSKRFDDYDSQITFAGYRFSQRDFMSMNELLSARYDGSPINQSKEMYTLSFSKQFRNLSTNVYFNYTHQNYWDGPANKRYSVSASRYFDLGRLKNLSVSLTGYSTKAYNTSDNGMYLSLSIPFGNTGSLSYSASSNRSSTTHDLSYFNRLDDRNTIMVGAGHAEGGSTAQGYFSHDGPWAQTVVSASHQTGAYSSIGMSLQGGATVTARGAALHRSAMLGGTRLMIDTQGVGGVPVRGNGITTETNRFGKAVITDVNSYYRNQASIDLDNLPDDVEAMRSVTQATLTDGAIGYRSLEVIAGEKGMVSIRFHDGSPAPFGVSVKNSRGQETGIVGDDGMAYLSGMSAGEVMRIDWSDDSPCQFTIAPGTDPTNTDSSALRHAYVCEPAQ